MARKEFNKSVVIEFPNANGNYILNQEYLNSFHALYVRKQGKPVAIKGGRKQDPSVAFGETQKRKLEEREEKRRKRKNITVDFYLKE